MIYAIDPPVTTMLESAYYTTYEVLEEQAAWFWTVRPVQSLSPIRAPIRAYVALNTNSVFESIRPLRCALEQNYHQTVRVLRVSIRTRRSRKLVACLR